MTEQRATLTAPMRPLLAAATSVSLARGVEPEAKPPARHMRDTLVRVDQARRLGTSPPSVESLWCHLVAGRCSLVDCFDHRGRRYLVVKRNDPAIAASRALTPRERRALGYLGRGHTGKYIAHALGISGVTVSRTLASAQRKLGVRSRMDLVRVARLLFGREVPR